MIRIGWATPTRSLQAWLADRDMTAAEFGSLVGASASGVMKWSRGERRPRASMMARICAVTNGAVEPNSFYQAEAA